MPNFPSIFGICMVFDNDLYNIHCHFVKTCFTCCWSTVFHIYWFLAICCDLLLVHLLVNLPHFHNVPIQLNCDKNWMSKEKTGLICRISVHLLVLSGRHYHDKYACFARDSHFDVNLCVELLGGQLLRWMYPVQKVDVSFTKSRSRLLSGLKIQKTCPNFWWSLGASVDLEGSVKACRDQKLRVPPKSDSSGKGSVFAQHLKQSSLRGR